MKQRADSRTGKGWLHACLGWRGCTLLSSPDWVTATQEDIISLATLWEHTFTALFFFSPPRDKFSNITLYKVTEETKYHMLTQDTNLLVTLKKEKVQSDQSLFITEPGRLHWFQKLISKQFISIAQVTNFKASQNIFVKINFNHSVVISPTKYRITACSGRSRNMLAKPTILTHICTSKVLVRLPAGWRCAQPSIPHRQPPLLAPQEAEKSCN